MLNRTARYLLAAIQAILGWEWLMSGGNKLLSGTFPQGLATTLTDNFKHNPNNWYVPFCSRISCHIVSSMDISLNGQR